MKTSIAVISFSPIHSDSRVIRQIRALSPHFVVHSIGYGSPPCDAISHLQIASHHNLLDKALGVVLLFFRCFDWFHSRWFHRARILTYILENDIEAVILNDVTSWPFVRLLPPGISILDAHEYSPQELSDQFLWRLFLGPFKIWCSQFASLGASRFCVEAHLCELWHSFSNCTFQLLPNSSYYTPVDSSGWSLVLPLRVLHHGVAHPSRRLELMIESIGLAGTNFTGTFLLACSDRSYLHRLQNFASRFRCEILPPVPQQDLISYGATFDIAILSIYPSNLNYAYCLPNKLYQFIQSRLPIVCGPTPSIAAIVRKYDIGVVAEDFSAAALAAAMQTLTPLRLMQMRQNLELAARELCWDQDQKLLVEAVNAVIYRGA